MLINCVKNLIMLASRKLVRDEIRESGQVDIRGFGEAFTPTESPCDSALSGREVGGGEGERGMGSQPEHESRCTPWSLGWTEGLQREGGRFLGR